MSASYREDNSDEGSIPGREAVVRLLTELRAHYILLIGLVSLCVVTAALLASLIVPSYMASAVVGPPTSSLTTSMMPVDEGSGPGGLVARLSKGVFSGSQATLFSIYTALLTSNRLAAVLSHKKGFMEKVFYQRFDMKTHSWRRRSGPITFAENLIKRAFHYPVKSKPDENDLAQFLANNLSVSTSLTSNFETVSFNFHNPAEAQKVLRTILITADDIVREDMRRDVSGRLTYLTKVLPTITQAEQRQSLISILSDQERQMMVIAADKHFAMDFVDPPHGNPRPTSPNPTLFALGAICFASMTWALLVFYFKGGKWGPGALEKASIARLLGGRAK